MTNGADIDAKKAMLHGAMWTVAMLRWSGKLHKQLGWFAVAKQTQQPINLSTIWPAKS
ncbi:hypothetical protein [Motilimonas eburnea]|uniref:hypothetical protein n=1 Tax=Motilimonas eburnea TaxID=1737488 RepID=UPI001E3F8888|nr:hypothetical protein [Motilimonas eburnea]